MTVSVNPPINTSIANGVTTVFPYDFKVLKNTDMRVLVNGAVRTEGVHYTISGVGTASGNITFLPGFVPATNAIVSRRRLMPFERNTDYVNLGDLLAATLNADQDAPVMMIQQLAASALRLIDDGEGGFVWDALGHRIINVGSGIASTDAANIGNVLTLIEQVLAGGGTVGVRPKYWEITGDGEDSDFILDGADVDDPLLYLVVVTGEVLEPYDGFTIVAGDTATQRVLRLPAALPNLTEGFVILTGYARPWSGETPVTSLALNVRTFAGTAETLDNTKHYSLTITTNASPVTETLRSNTGSPVDWDGGQFCSFHQKGAGQITIVLEGAGTLLTPNGFNPKSRAQGSIITATCEDPDTNTWVLSGDLERQVTSQELLVIPIEDRSVLIGTNIATGAGKGHFIMPFGFVLESIANGGVYASLAVAQGAGTPVAVDVNRNGVSLFSATLTFDNNEKTTRTAATPAVYASGGDVLYAGDEISIDVDALGTPLAKGLAVYLVGRRA